MELKQLRYFYDVLRLHSFTMAARANHVSQSAVSQKIKALEQEMGVKLLNRQGREFSATAAGTRMFEYAQSILAASQEAIEDVKRAAAGQALPRFTIGILASRKIWEPVAAASMFAQAHPETDVAMRFGTRIQLQRSLLNGSIDVVFADSGSTFADYFATSTVATRYPTIEIARSVIAGLPSTTLVPAIDEVGVGPLSEVACIMPVLTDDEAQQIASDWDPGIEPEPAPLSPFMRILGRDTRDTEKLQTRLLPDGTYTVVRNTGVATPDAEEDGDDDRPELKPTAHAIRTVEQTYLRTMLGFTSPITEAPSHIEAHRMVAAGRGFMVSESPRPVRGHGALIRYVPLVDANGPIRHEYMLIAVRGHGGTHVEEYEKMLRQIFIDSQS